MMDENEPVLWQDQDGAVLVHCYDGDMATFIRTERQKRGLTQAELAERTGVSRRTIQRYEQRGITEWTVVGKPDAVVKYLGGYLSHWTEAQTKRLYPRWALGDQSQISLFE